MKDKNLTLVIYYMMFWLLNCSASRQEIFLKSAESGDLNTLKFLISEKIPVDSKEPKFGNSALHLAAFEGHTDIVSELLINHANPNLKANDGITPLMAACRKGNLEISKLLVQYGANVNDQDDFGITALMGASYSGNKDLIKFLIKSKANINAKNNSGKSALDKAKDVEIKNLLIKLGAN
jgi:ankyrin repeat protein